MSTSHRKDLPCAPGNRSGMAPDLANLIHRRRLLISLALKRVRPGSGSGPDLLRARTWRHPVFNLNAIVTIPFVVVGGVATRLYSPERMTDDLDILVHAENAERLADDLAQAGAHFLGGLSIGGSQWRLPDGTLLDVLFSNEPWVEEALRAPVVAPDGLPVISLPYLVLMKILSSRGIDLGDLTRMLGGADEHALYAVRSVIQTYAPDAVDDLESLIMLGRLEYEQDADHR